MEIGEGGGVLMLRSTSIEYVLVIEWGFFGGLPTNVTFFLTDRGVGACCKLHSLGWDEEVGALAYFFHFELFANSFIGLFQGSYKFGLDA